MKRLKEWWWNSSDPGPAYAPLVDEDGDEDVDGSSPPKTRQGISLFEYFVFLSLGVAMLWSWNMFMACATYFQSRFAENDFLLRNFQSLILVVSTVTNLGSSFYLSHRQKSANYPWRICTSLVINCVVFAILALTAVIFRVRAEIYIVILLTSVLCASWSAGLSQNGIYAFANRFDGIYTQAIMTGQGVAGVLPAIAQIVSVVAIPQSAGTGSTASPWSACAYFLTATAVSGACLLLLLLLLSRHRISVTKPSNSEGSNPATPPAQSVSLLVLLRKLRYLCLAIWLCFTVTMVFPVYTQLILSVRPDDSTSTLRILKPDVFIPFGFLIWNVGDLSGRIICGWERFTLTRRPKALALAAAARLVFLPLYAMCNVSGKGAVVDSDWFYWLVQLLFGVTNGWVGSNVMMATPLFVDEGEKEASGGFMGLCLVFGLTSGSLLSFLVVS